MTVVQPSSGAKRQLEGGAGGKEQPAPSTRDFVPRALVTAFAFPELENRKTAAETEPSSAHECCECYPCHAVKASKALRRKRNAASNRALD
eukprot:CAMPEP_0194553874 /NCGR_PEP_ID=MMETSP0253-20130528/97451_1 /TAXON_ID=2966 /ORGANISM="Noctiluca scintillans" /LENGTH=90 /DNA_ID=CAMNT_0039401355 /DNA_START=19 /DNA_END=292 /DNA_ORIENTATION=+